MQNRVSPPALVLSAKRSVWRMHDHAGEADKAFRQVRKAILEEFDYKCAYCGHASEKYQEVHHADDNHANNDRKNLWCTCPLCHQVFHIGLAGMVDGADVVYLPELSQEEVNQLALVIWLCTEAPPDRYKNEDEKLYFAKLTGRAKTIQGMLETRRGTVLLKLRAALKDSKKVPVDLLEKIKLSHLTPNLFSNVLMSLEDGDYNRRAQLLGGLRLLPKPARFRERIKHWSEEQDRTLPVPSWSRILPEDVTDEVIKFCMEQVGAIVEAAKSSTEPSEVQGA